MGVLAPQAKLLEVRIQRFNPVYFESQEYFDHLADRADRVERIAIRVCIRAEVVRGCMDATAVNFEHAANVDDGSCIAAVPGCTDFTAFNFDFQSNLDDGSCIPRVLGCLQPLATNYRSEANVGTRCSPLVELEEAENITEPGDPYAHSELTWVKLDSQPRSPVNITMLVRYLNFSEAGDVLIELDN